MIPFILGAIIAYSGIFFGIGLKYIAPEEFPDGVKWLKLLQKIFIGIIIFLSITLPLPMWSIALLILILLSTIYYKVSPYPIFGIYFFINPLLFGPIIFIYGLTYGTLAQEKNIKITLKNIQYSMVFLIFCFLPFLLAYL